jgi:hypothetical protein
MVLVPSCELIKLHSFVRRILQARHRSPGGISLRPDCQEWNKEKPSPGRGDTEPKHHTVRSHRCLQGCRTSRFCIVYAGGYAKSDSGTNFRDCTEDSASERLLGRWKRRHNIHLYSQLIQNYGNSELTLATLNCRSAPITERSNDGKMNAQYELSFFIIARRIAEQR